MTNYMITLEDINTLYNYLKSQVLVEGSDIYKVRSKLKLIIDINAKQEELRNL